MDRFSYHRFFIIICFIILGPAFFQNSAATKNIRSTKKASAPTKTESLTAVDPPKESDLVKRDEMIVMARHLGVTCNYCHDIENFRDDRKPTYKTAKEHIEIVRILNQQGFKGKLKSNCYLCHRGKAKPDYDEP